MQRTARPLIDGLEVQLGAQRERPLPRARVGVGVEGRDGHAGPVHSASREHERIEPDRRHLRRARAGADERLVHHALHEIAERGRVLVRGAVGGRAQRGVAGDLRVLERARPAVVQAGPHGRAAHVEDEDERRLHGHGDGAAASGRALKRWK